MGGNSGYWVLEVEWKRRTPSEKVTAQGPGNHASIGLGVFKQSFVVFSRLVKSHFSKRVVLVCLVLGRGWLCCLRAILKRVCSLRQWKRRSFPKLCSDPFDHSCRLALSIAFVLFSPPASGLKRVQFSFIPFKRTEKGKIIIYTLQTN